MKYNNLINQKYKKTSKCLNFFKRLLILASAVTGSVSISAFASLVCVPVDITSSAVGLKICATTAEKIYVNYQKREEET